MNQLPPIFFIVGPTGVGKSAIAAEVAARCNGEIIGADAFQIYKGMDILSAKPSPALRGKIPHHLVDVIPLSQCFDVAQYLALAAQCSREISSRGKLPIVAGGTGLYVRALTHGLSDLPGANSEFREKLESLSLQELQRRLAELDPAGAAQIDLKNRRRLVRAIEVCELTGRPFSSFRNEWKTAPENIAGVVLERDRDDLHARINHRVVEMMHAGLLDEVCAMRNPGTTAGQAIGLKEAQACSRGEISLDSCIARIQLATRQYAKRQLTWFRRESHFTPLNLTPFPDPEPAISLIMEMISRKYRPT